MIVSACLFIQEISGHFEDNILEKIEHREATVLVLKRQVFDL